MRQVIPLSRRKGDIAILVFFWINILFITYVVDVEQIVLPDPAMVEAVQNGTMEYPLWPPKPAVQLIHWYGQNFDPVLIARPAWWRMTIWIDSLYFGPFYIFAIFAFTKGREWIRVPALVWAGLMIANVSIILGEEFMGPHATPHPWMVLALNLPWLLFPFFVIYRMRNDHPFTEEVAHATA